MQARRRTDGTFVFSYDDNEDEADATPVSLFEEKMAAQAAAAAASAGENPHTPPPPLPPRPAHLNAHTWGLGL